MEKARFSDILTVRLRDRDPKVSRSFEARLALLESTMGAVLSDLFFLEELALWRGRLLSRAPAFSSWLLEAKWREVLLTAAKLFESRRKTHEIKNFTTFVHFAQEHAERIFYRAYFHAGGSDEASGEAAVPTPSTDDLELAAAGFFEKHDELIEDILAYRDKSLVHLTGRGAGHDFRLFALRELILDASAVLDGFARKYDLGAFAPRKARRSDFFRLLD